MLSTKGYIELESQIEGITVWGPAPQETPQDISYKCPKCGATIAYVVSEEGILCEHCGYSQKITTQLVGRQAQKRTFTLDAMNLNPKGLGTTRRTFSCESCGSELSIAPHETSTTCPFCSSNRVIEQIDDPVIIRPDHVLPFKILPDQIKKLAKEWLGKGWLFEDGLANAGVGNFIGVYIPFWIFHCDIRTSWRAQVGTRKYYTDSNGNKTSKIVWHWKSGSLVFPIRDHCVTSSKHISEITLGKVMPFDMKDLKEYSPDFLAGWASTSWETALPEAWEKAKTSQRESAKNACYRQAGGDAIRNFSGSFDFDDERWSYALLPIYVSSYRHKEKVYQVLINGQNGLVGGQKPVAWWKIWSLIVLMQIPTILAFIISLLLLLAGPAAIAGFIVTVVFLILSVVGATQLYQWAEYQEKA